MAGEPRMVLSAQAKDTDSLMIPSLIVESLTICMCIGLTEDVARIRLDTNGTVLSHDDLASNMVQVVDKGQAAFLGAYSTMQYVTKVTDEIGRPGGLLDKLERNFGEPSAQSSTTWQISKFQTRIERSDQKSSASYEDFENLRKFVSDLRVSLANAKSDTTRKIDVAKENIREAEKAKELDVKIIQHREQEKNEAQERFGRVYRTYSERSQTFNFVAKLSIVSTCISIPAGTIAGVIGSCITGAMLSSVAQDLNAVEDRLDDRRKALREVQLRLALLEGQLDNWSKSKDKLEQSRERISLTLNLLQSLTQDIGCFLAHFIAMNMEIKSLMDAYVESTMPLEQIRGDISAGKHPNKYTYEDFKDQLVEMRKFAIRAHALSNVYEFVIGEVVNPAWRIMMETDHFVEESLEEVIATKRSQMRSYKEKAEKLCQAKAENAKRQMLERLSRVDSSREAGWHEEQQADE